MNNPIRVPQGAWYEDTEMELDFPSSWDITVCNMKGHDKAKLGIRVYPSEDGKVVRIGCNLFPFAPSYRSSPQIINIASPKL